MKEVSHSFTFAQINDSEYIPLINGWNLNGAPAAKYFLGKSASQIFFKIQIQTLPDYDSTLKPNDFIEGLWKRDIAELFIGNRITGEYQEFNIAPSSAWWSEFFNSYRQRAGLPINSSGLIVDSEIQSNCWIATLIIDTKSLMLPIDDNNFVYNICVISGSNPRHYLCSQKPLDETPDFHRFI